MEVEKLEYFGTNLTEHGHYRFILTENGMQKNWSKFDDLPFHPEYLNNNQQKGDVSFFQGGGFTVLAICGSCKDERPGSKSVFWVKEILNIEQIIAVIKQNKIAMSIIKTMPFNVSYFSN